MKYKIFWMRPSTGQRGQGSKELEQTECEKLARELNLDYPDIEHVARPVDWTPPAHVDPPTPPEIVHLLRDEIGLTICCGKTPFELPRFHRVTVDAKQVTCERTAA